MPSDHDLDTASPNSSFASVEIECGTPDHPGDESGSSCHINDKNGGSNELSTPCWAGRRYVMFCTKNYCVKMSYHSNHSSKLRKTRLNQFN